MELVFSVALENSRGERAKRFKIPTLESIVEVTLMECVSFFLFPLHLQPLVKVVFVILVTS